MNFEGQTFTGAHSVRHKIVGMNIYSAESKYIYL